MDADINKMIGRNLSAMRRFSGISQACVADLLGISTQQVQKYESGQNRLPIGAMYRLRTFFDVPYDYFFSGIENRHVMGMELLYADKTSLGIFKLVRQIEDDQTKEKIKQIVRAMAA